jgi:spore germination protein YaaH
VREPGPFDEILENDAEPRDRSASIIFIGMGLIGLILLFLVVSPFSLFGGGDDDGGDGTTSNGGGSRPALAGAAPKVPEGYEALSRLFEDIEKPQENPPYQLTFNLLQPVSDGRNIGLYTFKNGTWDRLASATLVNNGAAVQGEVAEIPENVAALRLTSSAVQVTGFLPAEATADATAISILTTVNPVDFAPRPDGKLAGASRALPQADGNIVPTVRAANQEQDDAVNAILASPSLQQEHITALVQLALQPGNAGVDIDYPRVNPARKADLTAFITVLSEQLHQANRTLSLNLPTPVKNGVSWDTGAYDWGELSSRADLLKVWPIEDPSAYYKRMDEVFAYLKDKVDFKKVALIVTRQSYEKATDGLHSISLLDGLRIASSIEVRTPTQITPNTSVVIVGKNIFQDEGASGMRWDNDAFAVSFSYPGTGGTRTVWLENSLSVAFRLDMARRYGLAGVAVADVSDNPEAAPFWEPLRTFSETGKVGLAQANSVLLRPSWQIQAGSSDAEAKGNIVWKAPAQPGSYEVSLIVSDGVLRAMQTVTLEVRAPGSNN